VSRPLLGMLALAIFSLICRADQTDSSTETVIRLTVQPMAAPKPALRYELLPEIKELNPGNPIEGYMRCFQGQGSFFSAKDSCNPRGQLELTLSADRPEQEVQLGASALRQADWAARLDKPDWQILLKLKTDGFGLLLPDLQGLRTLANGLKGRFHTEVTTGRREDAFRTAKTLFAMSRHTGEHPTLIGDLVGIAIAYVGIGCLEEMLEQPGCPNLYWALTNLPNPFVSMQSGLAGERVLVAGEFRDLDENAPMKPEQLRKLIAHIAMLSGNVRDLLHARIKDVGYMSAARRRLVEAGFPEERLLRFPAEQIILLDEMRGFDERRDEIVKFMTLPAWQVETLAGPISKPRKDAGLFEEVLPAFLKVRRAQGRLEQRIALLRHVEALRLYAADHDGRLPAKLAEVPVPLPVDPFTGKPFQYQVDGSTAHLRGSPPPGEEKNPGFNIHYEVTVQK
jgi:hypothetical protein